MFIKTVSTTSGINPIKFDETGGVFYWILNTGLSTIYASTKSTFTAGDDGVVSLGPKESRRLETNNDTIYILGAGQVEIHNQRDGICSFKQAPTSSGGGETIDAYTKAESDAKYAQKTDIPTTLPANGGNADTLDGLHSNEIVINPNLLINPDFKINQHGISGAFSDTGKYFIDRWRLVSGTVTVNTDGTITLNGSICQPLENAAGANVTASVSAGTAVYDNTTQTFTITGNGDAISWAKLEIGSVATPFVSPDPILELIKCQRFYYRVRTTTTRFLTGYCMKPNMADVSIPLFMRTNPTVDYEGLMVMCKDRTKSDVTTSLSYNITSVRGYRGNFGITLEFEVDTSSAMMSAGYAVILQATTPGVYGGYFALDAEIY